MSHVKELVESAMEKEQRLGFLWTRSGRTAFTGAGFPVIYIVQNMNDDEVLLVPRDLPYKEDFPEVTMTWDELNNKAAEDDKFRLLVDGLQIKPDVVSTGPKL